MHKKRWTCELQTSTFLKGITMLQSNWIESISIFFHFQVKVSSKTSSKAISASFCIFIFRAEKVHGSLISEFFLYKLLRKIPLYLMMGKWRRLLEVWKIVSIRMLQEGVNSYLHTCSSVELTIFIQKRVTF